MQVESTFGTDPGTPTLIKVPFISESLRLDRPNIYSEVIQSSRNPTAPNRGNHNVAGSIVTELGAYPGGLLYAALGGVVTSAPTHTIKIGASLPSYTIEKGFTDITTPQFFKYNGCKVNRMTINVRPAGAQQVTIEFIGAKETVGTTAFDATHTDLGKSSFQGSHISTITEGGSAIAYVTEADIVIDNNLDGNVYVINTTTPGVRRSLPEGLVKVSGTLKALFEDIALYTKAVAGTESALVVTYTLGTGAGTAGNEQLKITVPEILFAPNTPVISGPAGVLAELPFEAYYTNDAAASAIWFELKNTQTAINA
jgi:hypothetical protein